MKNTIALVANAPRTAPVSVARSSRPLNSASRMLPNAPIEAASVGAATPAMIEARTRKIGSSGGNTTRTSRRANSPRPTACRSASGIAGARSGSTKPSATTYSASNPASSSPGTNAAANSVLTEMPMMSPSRISTRLGGMICPSVPDAQITPHANPLSYPRRTSGCSEISSMQSMCRTRGPDDLQTAATPVNIGRASPPADANHGL